MRPDAESKEFEVVTLHPGVTAGRVRENTRLAVKFAPPLTKPTAPTADERRPSAPERQRPMPTAGGGRGGRVSAAPARITIARKTRADVRDRQIVVSLDGESLATRVRTTKSRGDRRRPATPPRAQTRLLEDARHRPCAGEHGRFKAIIALAWATYSLLGLLGVGRSS